MKRLLISLILLSLFYDAGLFAQPLSRADSIIWYLKQVKGLQSRDSVLLEKAVAAMNSVPSDSLPVDKIDSELKKLLPVIHRQNCLAVKFNVGCVLISGKNIDLAIKYDKELISELKGYSNEFEKNVMLWLIEWSRIPYRNTTRQDEGIRYYLHLVNDFEQARDSAATSACYWALGGLYRTIGLMDKSVYCNLKSMAYHNKNYILKGKNFLVGKYDRIGLRGYINKVGNLADVYIQNDEPKKAFPCLYEAKNILDAKKDSVDLLYADYIYCLITSAKMLTGGDSVDYYFDLMKKVTDLKNPTNSSTYYQMYGYYCFLQNRMDSAEYCIRRAAEIKKTNALWTNSTAGGVLIPGYYLAMIRIKQHKYTDAIKLLKDESDEALKRNLRKIVLQEWKLLADAYRMNGDFRNSNTILEQYVRLQKQIIDDENRSRSMSFETEQQISSLNAEKQKQQKEISRQKFIRNLIIGGLGLMIIFSIIFLLQRIRITKEKKRSEGLLLNILPYQVAEELKQTGHCQAKTFSMVTVMFMDFKDFTSVSEKVSAELLVDEINSCFSAIDGIIQKYKIEKIKTVGDAYICAGGLPVLNQTHARDIVYAAIEIQGFMLARKKEKEAKEEFFFDMRIGIHTGPVVAGIVGVKKFQYDIWGDTVNLAARMEQNSEAGKINISGSTYKLVKDKFNCVYRGKIEAKNKGEVEMYFVEKEN
jgi:class 3 adenylate cyclase